MKKRNLITLLISLAILIPVSIGFSLYFHEMGHALIALFFNMQIRNFHIGFPCFVEINMSNAMNWQIAFISLGSFIIPEIIYLLLLIFKNQYVTLFRVFSGILLYSNIIGNMIVLLFGCQVPEEWDILIFQMYTKIDTRLIFIFLLMTLVLNIILEILRGEIKKTLIFIYDYIYQD